MSLGNRITIVSVSDNHYAILLAALLKSIEVNHKSGEQIDFYIVEDRISDSNKQKINDSVNENMITIHWLSLSKAIPSDIKLPRDPTSFPKNIYARLFIPDIISEKTEKILYLDVDMIVLKDIAELWRFDLKNKIIGGVVDRPKLVSNSWGAILNYKELGLDPNTKYFNSGLLLIDPIKWRANNSARKIIEVVSNNLKYVNYPDQYGLNVVFANQWTEIEELWNCHSSSDLPNPAIIHFSGRKPIYKSYNNNLSYQLEFEKYANMTPWKSFQKVGEISRILKKLSNKVEKYLFE